MVLVKIGIMQFKFIVSEFIFQILYLFTNDIKNGLMVVIVFLTIIADNAGSDLDTLYTVLTKPSDTFGNMRGVLLINNETDP